MHQKTYDRLRETLLEAEVKADEAFDEKVKRLNQRIMSFGKTTPRGGLKVKRESLKTVWLLNFCMCKIEIF